MRFRVYRYNPETDAAPRMQDFEVEARPGMMLRDALLTLAGPAWDVSIDDGARQVCFRRHTTPVPASANPSATVAALPSDDGQGPDGREVQP